MEQDWAGREADHMQLNGSLILPHGELWVWDGSLEMS